MSVRLSITMPSAGEHKETAFYRVNMETTRGRGSAWKDFYGKKAKSRADAFADRWWRKQTASPKTSGGFYER